ncbi:MAG: PKD domain-containing protein [Bryobacteraceae bacterium]
MLLRLLLLACAALPGVALVRPGVEYKIYQFPADRIPRIDAKADDWAMVPESYSIGLDQLKETVRGFDFNYDRKNLDVRVKVGWVKGLNRLYVLYEATDDYWDFRRADRHNDIFELVVDGDLSGGPFIANFHPAAQKGGVLNNDEAYFQFHGVHAQNYHILTPAPDRDWAFVWGCQQWIKNLPWSNAAYDYNFRHGEGGKLTLEFWITPFDYAPYEGSERAVESKLWENKIIGMSWSILDYDGEDKPDYTGFWNLSHKTTMYGNADDLVAFRLMPLEPPLRKAIQARWSYQVLDFKGRRIAFHDDSDGEIRSWRWDFGDGSTSNEASPIHAYSKAGEYVVTLYIEGPAGKSQWTKVRDVAVP